MSFANKTVKIIKDLRKTYTQLSCWPWKNWRKLRKIF